MNKIKIRTAAISDIAAIMELYSNTVSVINSIDYTPEQIRVWSDITGMEWAWERHIKEQYFIVAESPAGTITGFASIMKNGYLDYLYVHKDHQREGVASALMDEIERKALEQKNREIFSYVSKTAKGLFEKRSYLHRESLTDKAKGTDVVFINSVMVKECFKADPEIFDNTIILIGPPDAGKSTQAQLLAQRIGINQAPMDTIRETYYKEIGYDEEHANKLNKEKGFYALFKYWRRFEVYGVERILADNSNCVIDMGAGHTVFDEPPYAMRIRAALEPYRNVILLLPSPDDGESIRILQNREGAFFKPEDEFNFHEFFVKHPMNRRLAKHVVYTEGKTPEQTCEEIVRVLS